MYRTCVNRSVPDTAGARFVVSDIGDSLSPKYAPLMMAPATQPGCSPRAVPMPASATPTVPTVPHDVPVASDRAEQMTQAAARNTSALRACNPRSMKAGMMPAMSHVPERAPMSSRMSSASEVLPMVFPMDSAMVCQTTPRAIPMPAARKAATSMATWFGPYEALSPNATTLSASRPISTPTGTRA